MNELIFKKYNRIINNEPIDGDFILTDGFSISQIMDMESHLSKSVYYDDSDEPYFLGKSIGLFNHALTELKIWRESTQMHAANLAKIANEYFPKSKIIYVDDPKGVADGVSIGNKSIDGIKRRIQTGAFSSLDITYTEYQEKNNYFFFSVGQSNEILIALDHDGFEYLQWSGLNHEQRTAKQFMYFINTYKNPNATLEQMGISNRHQLSRTFDEMIRGDHGPITFVEFKSDEEAEAYIEVEGVGDFWLSVRKDAFGGEKEIKELLKTAVCLRLN